MKLTITPYHIFLYRNLFSETVWTHQTHTNEFISSLGTVVMMYNFIDTIKELPGSYVPAIGKYYWIDFLYLYTEQQNIENAKKLLLEFKHPKELKVS